MIKRNTLLLAFLVIVMNGPYEGSALLANQAVDVTGDWSGLVSGHNGSEEERPVDFKFKQDGKTLTGTVTGSLGSASIILVDAFDMTEGTASDGDISFALVFPGEMLGQPGKKMKLLFQGSIVNGEIRLVRSSVLDREFTVSTTTESQRFVLKRK